MDYVIVCGDFGLCWAKDGTFEYNCKFFAEKKFTLLWVQGNHENYDMIAKYPMEEWHGGKVRHIVRDKVILLERGQVFEIEGKTFFTFGGASSHDIQGGVLDRKENDFAEKKKRAIRHQLPYRILHESWWEEELPTEMEMEEGRKNLAKHNYKVDYVITHCCASKVQEQLDKTPGCIYEADVLTEYFQEIEEKLQYTHWYFGHYHMDMNVDEFHTLLYHGMVALEEKKELDLLPVLGKPRYTYKDKVRFILAGEEKLGVVRIVDAYGTYEQGEEPSYDIYVEEDKCLYKHVCESEVIGKEIDIDLQLEMFPMFFAQTEKKEQEKKYNMKLACKSDSRGLCYADMLVRKNGKDYVCQPLVRTGAEVTIFSAQELEVSVEGLSKKSVLIGMETIEVYKVKVDCVKLGENEIYGVDFVYVSTLEYFKSKPVLGMDYIAHMNIKKEASGVMELEFDAVELGIKIKREV